MKQLYVCEKCGKTWENHSEAYDCEDSHKRLDFDSVRDELSDFVIYKEGGILPAEFVVRGHVEQMYVNGEWVDLPCVYARYVLKSTLGKADSAALEEKRQAKAEEDRIRNEEYWADRRAKRAAEEAEKKAAEEEVKRQIEAVNAKAQDVKEALAI